MGRQLPDVENHCALNKDYLFIALLSAKIGLALTKSTALATAIIVNVGMMTSSPGPTLKKTFEKP